MFALGRWWTQYGFKATLATLAIAVALWSRSTHGAFFYEAYHWLTRPLQPGMSREQRFENSYILELQQRLVELESQNRALQASAGYQPILPSKSLRATVIGRAADHWWQHIILNRGSQDGVKPGYVVTGLGGLVGRVVEVSPQTSRVLLVSDLTSRIGARISRSRVMGVVRGQSNHQLVMEFFDKLPDVKPGDVVTTSAYSRLFPENIPLGRVESMTSNQGTAPEATIQLSAPLPILEWVIIQPFQPLPSIDLPEVAQPGVDGSSRPQQP
ncbi:MAG: rod shape-determining protein MreC [Cyanobacteria bacterium REEB459]|nr:rod shape-determining protein MreC [Cyanobacteria bacterium REEB459]